MDQIVLEHVTKTFTTKALGAVTAVDDFNLKVQKGECFSFLGPSGCGKTTTLRMIAGFEDLSDGTIYLGGKPVSVKKDNIYIPPEDRGLGMVFQAFAVWPHMTIFDNVAFPLQVQHRPAAEIRDRVRQALKHCSLDGMEKIYPSDLSGGQQQRIALARAIVTNPDIMLLDEPLSNLDPQLRESMRFEIKKLQKKFGFTIIFVTHDQSEAMALSDRMLVMDMGNIQQVGTPIELYNNPNSRFVHSFLGQSNFTDVEIQGGRAYAEGDESHPLWAEVGAHHGHMVMATRPNTIDINRDQGYPSRIIKRIFRTDFVEYLVSAGDSVLRVQTPHRNLFQTGDACYLRFPNPMWYAPEDDLSDKERARRMIV